MTSGKTSANDPIMLAAMREVDEMTPGSPQMAPSSAVIAAQVGRKLGGIGNIARELGFRHEPTLDRWVHSDGRAVDGLAVASRGRAAFDSARSAR